MLPPKRLFDTGLHRREQAPRGVDSRCDFSRVGEIQLVFAGKHPIREVTQSIVRNSRISF